MATTTSLQQLLDNFYNSDGREGFYALYEKVSPKLWSYIHKKCPRSEAEDVFQDVMLDLLQALERKRVKEDHLLPLIFTITNRRVADFYRKRYREGNRFSSFEEHQSENTQPPFAKKLLQRLYLISSLRRKNVSPEQEKVLVMKTLCGYTLKEISEQLNIPPDTAASRLRRAREKLQI